MKATVVEVTEEKFVLRTGLGRKVFEGDEAACRKRAVHVKAVPGLAPKLVLVKQTVIEEQVEVL